MNNHNTSSIYFNIKYNCTLYEHIIAAYKVITKDFEYISQMPLRLLTKF